MSDFHTSLDAALNGTPRWVEADWLGESPDKFCDSCGTRVIDGRGVVHPCPICDDTRSAA